MDYLGISSYGVIGDMHTAALVGTDGSIDWCCFPYFDSPSIFAKILDHRIGGWFRIAATADGHRRQMYLPETNVLVTRFLSPEGVGEVVDFMPARNGVDRSRGEIIRIVRGVRGSVRFRADCQPGFDYARAPHRVEVRGSSAI